MYKTRAESRREGGQTLLIFVLALTVLLGFTAMAIDVGLFFENRRHLQNTADAAALAGVAELPGNPALAKSKAAQWAAKHGVSSSELKKVEVRTTDYPNDTLYVEVPGRPQEARTDAQYFAKWIDRLEIALRERNRFPSAAQRNHALAQLEAARKVYVKISGR